MKTIVISFTALVGIFILRKIFKAIYYKKITPTMRFVFAANASTSLHTFKTCVDIKVIGIIYLLIYFQSIY